MHRTNDSRLPCSKWPAPCVCNMVFIIKKSIFGKLHFIYPSRQLPYMRQLTPALCLIIIVCFFGCTPKEKHVTLMPLGDGERITDSSYSIPVDKRWDEGKRIHDSCMGSAFPANALFLRNRDTIRLGTIVNRKTMKPVIEWDMRPFINGQIFRMLNVVTKPCYSNMPMNITVSKFFGKKVNLLVDSFPAINTELNNLLETSASRGVEMGSWLTAELTTAITGILDTTKSENLLAYKAALLDTNNIVLVRSASITNVTFFITPGKPLSKQFITALQRKPYARIENSYFMAQLFYIDDNTFQLNFSGYFQVMGQFMRGASQ